MKVFFTWPSHYSDWDRGIHSTNAQCAWHTFHGLRERFEDVQWVHWDMLPDGKIPEGARLYTHTSWPVGRGGIAFPRVIKALGGEVYGITNCPLRDYVTGHGMYDLHGYNGFDNRGENFDPLLPCGYAQQQMLELKNMDVMFVHASNVGLDLWHGRRPGGEKRREYVKGYRFVPFHSPIDKQAFRREVFDLSRKKMLITNGFSPRKNQGVIRALFSGRYVEFPTTNWSWRRPGSYEQILNQCSFLAHPSLQESEPYFMTEGLAKGLLPIGGEDWFDGYGYEELIWRQSADGSTNAANVAKVDFLLSDSPRMQEIYDDVQTRFRERKDNEWSTTLDLWAQPVADLPIA